ncbi:hypothetical protein FQR65_LT17883 [Abscondita terminalis]|nr:hypothetical protein FQR65_LT17883 [Abscondita terminalis]
MSMTTRSMSKKQDKEIDDTMEEENEEIQETMEGESVETSEVEETPVTSQFDFKMLIELMKKNTEEIKNENKAIMDGINNKFDGMNDKIDQMNETLKKQFEEQLMINKVEIKTEIQRIEEDSRSVPLNWDSVSTTIGFCGVEPEKKSMDTSNAEVQNVSLDSISTASSSWSFATNYDLANESRLLNFNNASNKKLVNSSCYKLDYNDEENTLKLGIVHICSLHRGPYNTHYNDREKKQRVAHYRRAEYANESSKPSDERVFSQPRLMLSKTSDISRDLKIIYTTEYRPDLGWSECNNNGFVNTICLTRDYKNCILNKWDVDCMFGLKDIINYRLELMQSYKLDVVFNGVIKRMVIELDKVKKKKH